jgi:hypothetical protein
MYPSAKRFLGLGIDVSLPDQTAKSGLDMGARTAEAIVKIEMAEGGIEVVAPKQVNHPAAQPDAFGIAGRASQDAGRLGDLVYLFLGFLGRVGGRFLRLRRLAIAALGEGRGNDKTSAGYATQHGDQLTQLERNRHLPRRLFVFSLTLFPRLLFVRPDWDANTAVIYLVNRRPRSGGP